MAINWQARLREQGRFAKRMASEVPVAFGDPGLTREDALQLYRTVENCARGFDEIVARMEREGVDPSYLKAAEVVSELWLDLSRLAADKASLMIEPARRSQAARY